MCLSEGVVSSSERVALPHHIRLLLTLRAGGARRNLSSVFPLCGHTDNNRTTAGKMVFLLHMVTLYTLSVFSGASAATHCEYYSCNGPLLSALPHSSFQSSTQSSASYAAHNAKLNRRDGAGGWSPMVTDQEPWLQVDLREQMEVTAVATQGRYDSWDWVSSYQLLYSDTGRAWKQYRHEDGVGRFVGNVNSEAVVQNKLSHPVRTRFLRFIPLQWNPSGWMGLRVEAYGCSYSESSLLYRFNQKSMSTVKDVISLRFKSNQAEGVLLHGEGQRGDYITLELHRGRLDLYINLDDSRLRFSSGRVAVTVGSLLDDQQWHSVHIERFNKQVNLTVDSHTQHFQTKGEGHSLEVDYELSFGGIPLPGKPGTFLRKNFHGCMENLYYNGINVIDLAKRRKPQIHSVGNVTFSCSQPQLVACTFLSSSSSFLSLPSAASASGGFSDVEPGRAAALGAAEPEPHRLELQISNSRLLLTLHSPGRPKSQSQRRSWHSVSLDTRNLQIALTVDSEPSSAIELWNNSSREATSTLEGCVRLIFINSQPIYLNHVQQGLLGNYNSFSSTPATYEADAFLTCVSTEAAALRRGALSPATVQELDTPEPPVTTVSSSSSHFFISSSSFNLPFCPLHPLIFSRSTELCHLIQHTPVLLITFLRFVKLRLQSRAPLFSNHIMKFNYSASADQLRAIVSGSEQCQQEVVYNCRKSRLFNTKDGSPLTWWLDWQGEKRSYWGGFLPGVQQCSCSLEENCVDMNYFCNCDADTDSWANDTGILSYKDHLPVSQIVIGDTNRTGSQASIWNAASFYQESSYLYFPTLQAELASDISFHFKTSAPSGVFLENQGLKDFIRVELSSPSVVTFSFDVGNGPAILSVKSHLPLNDRQWHYVRAERNAKEASLQVDQLPPRFLEAPADGHLRLRLSSQLFERAKLTPGVTSGCPGYCSGSSSLCHNRGRCIEKSNGYVCDCSQSAYGGTTCDQEVSVSFDMESSVTYTFQEPFSVMQNRSSQASSVSTESSSRAREDVAFSFVTSQRPAMLLTVSTFSQQYIAVILAKNGSLQIWYHLQTDRSPDVFSPVLTNLADGRFHRIRIHRIDQDIHRKYTLSSDAELILIRSLTLGKVTRRENLNEEVTHAASKGFIGCLSSVQFNHVAPLKAALTNRGSSLVTIRGPLVQSNCGALAESTSHTQQDQTVTANKDKEQQGGGTQKDLAVIAGVVTAVVFIAACALAVISRLLYQQRRARGAAASKKRRTDTACTQTTGQRCTSTPQSGKT
ncbi:hypothetical protein F7725_002325 [Dissostichus mawsoni]|uniref:Contactin associated protein-like 5a n=1 Tax=Dissostichus mawsoni TaxID=36200 RepID=A0A7J5Y232_DISMA|nr:hypothetical protein F7725_002325 [Dissostichus mawsoni]